MHKTYTIAQDIHHCTRHTPLHKTYTIAQDIQHCTRYTTLHKTYNNAQGIQQCTSILEYSSLQTLQIFTYFTSSRNLVNFGRRLKGTALIAPFFVAFWQLDFVLLLASIDPKFIAFELGSALEIQSLNF